MNLARNKTFSRHGRIVFIDNNNFSRPIVFYYVYLLYFLLKRVCPILSLITIM